MKNLFSKPIVLASLAATLLGGTGNFSNTALATGGGAGPGGGHAIICGPKVQFYDIHEGQMQGLQMDFGPGRTTNEVLAYGLRKLARLDSARARTYAQQAAMFEQEANFVTEQYILDVPDTGIGLVPNGCKYGQLAAQVFDQPLIGARYIVNKDLWTHADIYSQAALKMHELIYREAGQQPTSENVRRLNELIWSTKMNTISRADYVAVSSKAVRTFQDQNGFLCDSWGVAKFVDADTAASCSLVINEVDNRRIYQPASKRLVGLPFLNAHMTAIFNPRSAMTVGYLPGNNIYVDRTDFGIYFRDVQDDIGNNAAVTIMSVDSAQSFSRFMNPELNGHVVLNMKRAQLPMVLTGLSNKDGFTTFKTISGAGIPTEIHVKLSTGVSVDGSCNMTMIRGEILGDYSKEGLYCKDGSVTISKANEYEIHSSGVEIAYNKGPNDPVTVKVRALGRAHNRFNLLGVGWFEYETIGNKLATDTVLPYESQDDSNQMTNLGFLEPIVKSHFGSWSKTSDGCEVLPFEAQRQGYSFMNKGHLARCQVKAGSAVQYENGFLVESDFDSDLD